MTLRISDTSHGEITDAELLLRASHYGQSLSLEDLTERRLRDIASEHGSDFATAVAFERVKSHPLHGSLLARLKEFGVGEPAAKVPHGASVALVPNLGYFVDDKSKQAGAVIFKTAEACGFSSFIVPTSHTGTLSSNADVICDLLMQQSDAPIVVVSISKGSSDLKIAFEHPAAEQAFRNVVAWINLCGLDSGTAVVNTMMDARDAESERNLIKWFRRKGEDYVQLVIESMRECGRGTDRPLGKPLHIPEHIRSYHVAAFPLAKHFQYHHAKMLNQILLPLGPNDGFALLADLINKPGTILPVWGADHYIDQAMDVTAIIFTLLHVVCEDCGWK